MGIDLLDPFPLSQRGNKMIIVAVNYLTKWVELKGIPTGKAEYLAEFYVNQIFLPIELQNKSSSTNIKFSLLNLLNQW